MGPMVTSVWKSKDYSAPVEEIISLVGKSTGMPEATSGGFHTLDCWGGPNEIGSPTTIFWQKATRGTSLANPNGTLHVIDVLRPYQLVGCGGDEGRGRGELLGECGLVGYIRRLQANLLHLGPVQRGYGAAIQAGHRGR